MSEQAGEKTEQASPKRLEEAIKRGQIARSPEIQTVLVVMAGWAALRLTGESIWNTMGLSLTGILGHLHEIPLTHEGLQRNAIQCALVFGAIVGPVLLATLVSGILAGAVQNRFQATPEALSVRWERLNPMEGFQRLFSMSGFVPSAISVAKLAIIGGLTYSEVQRLLGDPIFFTSVDITHVGLFLIQSASVILVRSIGVLAVMASLDYGWQFWKTRKDLMMTRQDVKEELKGSEGNPEMKSRMRRRRRAKTMRQMLAEVPKADVVVTNPTHIAIALRYDRKTMRAPKIVAKGTRLNALRIREIARSHQVPILENKPLARFMFKNGRVGAEIPAQIYAAVAEILAWVYRVNRYRYYAEGNQV